ncbi:IS30 family transposase [Lacticaseibacillus paracasei]|uniref:IS30 family transposase n=1 Tax=Lacticaseibacillus paracasei TaxID=1597 RepID=UPI000BBDCCCB|nr:IS30 family transposase [Lacticaseibacillus paracasei]PCL21902.1 IS30 family transposase [Lacticaseibacillus paracasei]PCL32578.1 IS30 family transposase [Lacticaseibacillus paracasei]WRM19153.1 IS30 family transposase [Lacticaseibacillus paracasei]
MTQSQTNTPRRYRQLTLDERGQIQALKQTGLYTITKIAEMIHRDKSTVSRELKRGTVDQIHGAGKHVQQYFAETGAAVYEKHRAVCHPGTRLEQCPEFYAELVVVLRQRPRVHSVDSFVQTYKQAHPELPCPSTPTVYRDIEKGLLEVRNGDLPMKPRRRVKSDAHKHARTNKRVYGKSIEERPDEVEDRQTVGHWEGDLVKGTRVEDEPALMTMTERATRFEIILKLPNYHAETCLQGLQSILDDYGVDNFKTVTFDNGSEFAKLSEVTGTTVYYAHPYSPWERGTNENANGLIREFIPKGHSLHEYDIIDIQSFQDALNQRPRRSLEYRCAADLLPEL